jgi:hypothetical protein
MKFSNPFEKPTPAGRMSYSEQRREEKRKKELKDAGLIAAGVAAAAVLGGEVGATLVNENDQARENQVQAGVSDRADFFNETANPAYEDENLRISRTEDTRTIPEVHIKHSGKLE